MVTKEPVVGLTTATSEEEAVRLAHGLVDARLAACVQVTAPITAVYRWQGQKYAEPEWQLWIKTSSDKVDAITGWLPGHHSAEVPELVFVPVLGGLAAYLDWIVDETR